MLYGLIIFYTILVWVIYHSIFIVIYRNVGRGIIKELTTSLLFAVILTAVTVTYWKALIIIIAVVGAFFIIKAPGKTKIVVLLVTGALVACVYWAGQEYLEQYASKNTEEKKELTDEEFVSAVEELEKYSIVCNSNSSSEGFVCQDSTYVSHDNGIIWINMEYYPNEWNPYRIDIDAYFTTDGSLDTRRLYQSFYSEDSLFPAYFMAPEDETFNEEYSLLVNGDGTVTIEYKEDDINISGKYSLATAEDVKEYNDLRQSLIDELTAQQEGEAAKIHHHEYCYKNNGDNTHTVYCADDSCDYSEVQNCSFINGTCQYCGYTYHLRDVKMQEGDYYSPYSEERKVSLWYDDNDQLHLSYKDDNIDDDVVLKYNEMSYGMYIGDTADGTHYLLEAGYYGAYSDSNPDDIYVVRQTELGREDYTLYLIEAEKED
ncbi:MAG: hypothetical protein K6F66_03130 [Pseudobutyrivibrio sp.]|nr:hypothetical protein [Pseudobutyrivibrio sp.]